MRKWRVLAKQVTYTYVAMLCYSLIDAEESSTRHIGAMAGLVTIIAVVALSVVLM